MYAQLGNIVFEPLSGFDALGDQLEGTIAQYGRIEGKPWPVAMAPNLRELNIGIRLHQRFIVVKDARLQLRAYIEQGTTVTLTWGTGEIEGRWLVKNVSCNVEEGDGIGNVYAANFSVSLLEVPGDSGSLLKVKEGEIRGKAFAFSTFNSTEVIFPPKRPPSALELFRQKLKLAMRYAALIEALAYGGKFPKYMGSSLGQIMGNAKANMALMGTMYGSYGSAWDVPDVSGAITDVADSLDALSLLDPIVDGVDFVIANNTYQGLNRLLIF